MAQAALKDEFVDEPAICFRPSNSKDKICIEIGVLRKQLAEMMSSLQQMKFGSNSDKP